MRYFKYDGPWDDLEAMKRQYGDLSDQARQQRRKAERMRKLGTAVFSLLFLVCFAGLVILIHLLWPEENTVFGEVLAAVCKVFLGLIALILSAIIASCAAMPLWAKHSKTEKELTRQTLTHACAALREYYGFQEPFLVTKCYRSSDRRFDRHDVCIFAAGNELRITANLHYGFFDPSRDLGCYVLSRQELTLQDARHKDRPAVELQAGEVTFCLGCRAKSFIETYFP